MTVTAVTLDASRLTERSFVLGSFCATGTSALGTSNERGIAMLGGKPQADLAVRYLDASWAPRHNQPQEASSS